MPAGAEVTYSVRCGRSGNDTVIVSSAPRRATAPLLVSGVRWLNERDQSLNTEHTFRCGSAPMGKIEVSINPNVVKTTSTSSMTPLGPASMICATRRRSHVLLVLGTARVGVVDGVPSEYPAGSRTIVG